MSANTNLRQSPAQVVNPRIGDLEAAGLARDAAVHLADHGHTTWAQVASLDCKAAAHRVRTAATEYAGRRINSELAAASKNEDADQAERWAQEAQEAVERAEERENNPTDPGFAW